MQKYPGAGVHVVIKYPLVFIRYYELLPFFSLGGIYLMDIKFSMQYEPQELNQPARDVRHAGVEGLFWGPETVDA